MEPLETKYGHVFVDGEDKYVLIRVLATGSEASAQLVVHAQTGDLFVRKVGKMLLDESQKKKEDPERILFLVQSQARLRGVQLNTAHLYSAGDVPAPQRGGRELLYHRVKYFKFYNGGNLGDFRDACQTRDIAPPPSLICKMIQQVAHALNFMYSMSPYVFHGDLHMDNIFLHWDQNISEGPEFILGDFGWSTCGRIRAGNRFGLGLDISHVWMNTQALLEIGASSSSQGVLRQYLEDEIEPELRRLAYGPVSRLPDLAHLLKLLSTAPATTPPDMRPFMLTPEPHSPPSPLLYDTREEVKNAKRIHGPWHIARVSIVPSSRKLNVVSMSPSTYHRPLQTPADDKDEKYEKSDDWEEIDSAGSEDWTFIPPP